MRLGNGVGVLRQRVASALVGLALLALALWLGGSWGWAIFVALVAVLGVLEFYRLARHLGVTPLTTLGCLWTAALVLSQPAPGNADKLVIAVIGAGILATIVFLLVGRDKRYSLTSFSLTVAGVLYVGLLSCYLVSLREQQDGRDWIILTLLTTFAVDTGAYFIGHVWGRHRLAPQISPGKSKEGALAGLAAGMLAAWAIGTLLHLPLSAWKALLLGLLISVFAQIGDLAESMFKRSAGVKDSGRIMPGHGGILDRIDSILLAGIVVYYYVMFV